MKHKKRGGVYLRFLKSFVPSISVARTIFCSLKYLLLKRLLNEIPKF